MPLRYLLLGVAAALCTGATQGLQLARPAPQSGSTPDVSLSIAAASINSAIETYTAVGALAWTGKVPGNINTSIFEQILPVAYKACQDCPLKVRVAPTIPPYVDVSAASGASATVTDAVAFFSALDGKMEEHPLFVISLNGSATMNFTSPKTGSSYIRVHASVIELQIAVKNSSIGPTPASLVPVLNPLIDSLISGTVIPYLNQKFPGIPIPVVDGIAVSNVDVLEDDDRIGVSFDVDVSENLPLHSPLHRRALAAMVPHPKDSPKGDMVLEVGGAALNKVLQKFLPQVTTQVNNLVIPAQSGKASGIDYSTKATHVSNFAIGGATIDLVAGTGVRLTLNDISLAIPSTGFSVEKKIIFKIKCSGHFDGHVSGMAVSLTVNVTRDESGTPKLHPSSSWKFGDLSVSQKMDSTGCKIISDIAKLFIGSINGKIEDAIKSLLPKEVDIFITSYGDQLLAQLTSKVNVGSDASIDFSLAENPTTTQTQLALGLLGIWGPPS